MRREALNERDRELMGRGRWEGFLFTAIVLNLVVYCLHALHWIPPTWMGSSEISLLPNGCYRVLYVYSDARKGCYRSLVEPDPNPKNRLALVRTDHQLPERFEKFKPPPAPQWEINSLLSAQRSSPESNAGEDANQVSSGQNRREEGHEADRATPTSYLRNETKANLYTKNGHMQEF